MGVDQEILSAYKQSKSIREVTRKTGYSRDKIVKTLSIYGINFDNRHGMILAMYERGDSLPEIAENIGISIGTLRAYVPRLDQKEEKIDSYEILSREESYIRNRNIWRNSLEEKKMLIYKHNGKKVSRTNAMGICMSASDIQKHFTGQCNHEAQKAYYKAIKANMVSFPFFGDVIKLYIE